MRSLHLSLLRTFFFLFTGWNLNINCVGLQRRGRERAAWCTDLPRGLGQGLCSPKDKAGTDALTLSELICCVLAQFPPPEEIIPSCNISEGGERDAQNTGLDLRSFVPSLAPSLAFCCASPGAHIAIPAQRGAPGGAGSRRDQISTHGAGAAPILPDALLRWLAEIRCPARKVDLMRFLLLF